MSEYVLDASLGFDTILFSKSVGDTHLPAPGRPNIVATISVILLATGMLISRGRNNYRFSTVSLIAAIVIGLSSVSLAIALTSHDLFTNQDRLAGSLPTALSALALALSLLSLGIISEGVDRPSLQTYEMFAGALAAIAVTISPTVVIKLTERFMETGFASPLGAVMFASIINAPLVVIVLSGALYFLRKERELLLFTQERLSLATEAHQISVFIWDLKADVVSWPEYTEHRFGLSPGTITNFESWAIHVHPTDVLDVKRRLAIAAENQQARFSFRYRFNRPDGQVRQIEGSAKLVYDNKGHIESAIGVNIDVTEQERDKAQLQSIVETVPEAMVVIDEYGIIERFSPTAEQMFGWDEADIIGRNVSALMPDVQAAAHPFWLQRYLGGGKPRVIGQTRQLRVRTR